MTNLFLLIKFCFMYMELMLLVAYKFCFPLLNTDLYSLRWFPWVQGINSQSEYLFSRCLRTHTHLKWLYLLRKLNILSLVMLFDSKVYSFWYYYWYISFLLIIIFEAYLLFILSFSLCDLLDRSLVKRIYGTSSYINISWNSSVLRRTQPVGSKLPEPCFVSAES